MSVVIPTYNGATTIRTAVNSVLAHASASIAEVVVVNDGSTDDTPTVLSAPFERDILVRHQPRAGRSAARNAGARAAGGGFLVFLDDDDALATAGLSALQTAIDPVIGPPPHIVRLGVRYLEPDDPAGDRTLLPTRADPFVGPFIPGSFAISRDLFAAIGGYDEQLGYSENNELLFRATLAARDRGWATENLPTIGVDHSHRRNVAGYYREERIAATRHILHKHGPALRALPRVHADILGVGAHDLFRIGRTREALALAARSVVAQPRPKSVGRVLRIVLSWPKQAVKSGRP